MIVIMSRDDSDGAQFENKRIDADEKKFQVVA